MKKKTTETENGRSRIPLNFLNIITSHVIADNASYYGTDVDRNEARQEMEKGPFPSAQKLAFLFAFFERNNEEREARFKNRAEFLKTAVGRSTLKLGKGQRERYYQALESLQKPHYVSIEKGRKISKIIPFSITEEPDGSIRVVIEELLNRKSHIARSIPSGLPEFFRKSGNFRLKPWNFLVYVQIWKALEASLSGKSVKGGEKASRKPVLEDFFIPIRANRQTFFRAVGFPYLSRNDNGARVLKSLKIFLNVLINAGVLKSYEFTDPATISFLLEPSHFCCGASNDTVPRNNENLFESLEKAGIAPEILRKIDMDILRANLSFKKPKRTRKRETIPKSGSAATATQ